jgi:hypothetical protein
VVAPRGTVCVLVGDGECSCERAACRASRRLVGEAFSRRKLVGEAPNLSGMRRLASDGLDRGS